jgi:hypothetical protein
MVPKLPEHHSQDEGRLEDVDPKFLLQRVVLGARELFAVLWPAFYRGDFRHTGQ